MGANIGKRGLERNNMTDQNTPLPLDGSQSEQEVTDQNNEQVEDTTQQPLETEQSQNNQQVENDQNVEQPQADGEQLSRSERRQQRYAEKMADRLRSQSEQDAQFGKQLFAQNDEYKPLQYDQETEFGVDQLANDRRQYGQQTFNEGVRQGQAFYEAERFADRLDTDIERVLSKRDDIDDVTEKLLVESYLDKVGAREDQNGRIIIGNPNLRFRDFAESKLKEIDDLVQVKLSQSTKNIASQAANTGVRPNGASQSSVSNLSDNELIEKLRAADIDSPEGKKLIEENRRRQRAMLGF
jgi:hypothetical protein